MRIKPALTWTEIGEQMPGRKASGCMMRWYNFIREDGVAGASGELAIPVRVTRRDQQEEVRVGGRSVA